MARALLLIPLAVGCLWPPVPTIATGAGTAGVPLDEERARYRDQLQACARRRLALLAEAQRARRRHIVEALFARAAVEVATRRGGVPYAPGNPQAASGDPCPGQEGQVSPCATPVAGLVGHDPRSPRARATDRAYGDARREVRRIDARIVDADTFLFSHPDPGLWTDAEREGWRRRLARLGETCAADGRRSREGRR